MKKVLFVCHGNICRSVMGQWIFQDMVNREGLEDQFVIDSAAVSNEEIGNSIYPNARRKLEEKGIPVGEHRARRITKKDYETFDEIYLMDRSNFSLIRSILPTDPEHKIKPLLENRAISDPWYTRDFETAYRDIEEGCRQRLNELLEEKN